MKNYLALLQDILTNGNVRPDRTGTGTLSVFSPPDMRFDLSKGFPLVTTKQVHLRSIIQELLWFLRGSTDNNVLVNNGVHIWTDWAIPEFSEIPLATIERFDHIAETEHIEEYYTWSISPELHAMSHEQAEAKKIEWCKARGIKTTRLIRNKNPGALGPVYGHQWRSWTACEKRVVNNPLARRSEPATHEVLVEKHIDQIAELIEGLREKPFSRRHIVSAWNVADLPDESVSPQANVANGKMALAPCHVMFQFYVQTLSYEERLGFYKCKQPMAKETILQLMDEFKIPKYKLSCKLYQRSADTALGLPFNIASYALLTMMVAQCVGMVPGEFIHSLGDAHAYGNHLEGIKEQLTREPYPLPTMTLNPHKTDIFSFELEDFTLENYQSHGTIKFPIST